MTLYLDLCVLLDLFPSYLPCLQFLIACSISRKLHDVCSNQKVEVVKVLSNHLLPYGCHYCLSVDAIVCHLQVDRVIFCVFLNVDYKIYQRLLYYYFPPETSDESEGTPLHRQIKSRE